MTGNAEFYLISPFTVKASFMTGNTAFCLISPFIVRVFFMTGNAEFYLISPFTVRVSFMTEKYRVVPNFSLYLQGFRSSEEIQKLLP